MSDTFMRPNISDQVARKAFDMMMDKSLAELEAHYAECANAQRRLGNALGRLIAARERLEKAERKLKGGT